MRVYVDSSALVKRSVDEAESDNVEAAVGRYLAEGAAVVTSSLTRIEISRVLRARSAADDAGQADVAAGMAVALSGVAESAITDAVVSLAERIAPSRLRTLDAIHLATAIILDVDVVVTYDTRLTEACRHNGLSVVTP